MNKVVFPLGFAAGMDLPLDEALSIFGSELMGHRSDLRERASRHPEEREELERQAVILERYAVAMLSIVYQVKGGPIEVLRELAAVHQVTLPMAAAVD